jgi:hypothetical protein
MRWMYDACELLYPFHVCVVMAIYCADRKLSNPTHHAVYFVLGMHIHSWGFDLHDLFCEFVITCSGWLQLTLGQEYAAAQIRQ